MMALVLTLNNLEQGLTQNGTVNDGQQIGNGSLTQDITNTERGQNIVLCC